MLLSSSLSSTGPRMAVFRCSRLYGVLLVLALYSGVALLCLNRGAEARLGKQITTVQIDDMFVQKRRSSKLIEGGAAFAVLATWPLDVETQKYVVPYDFTGAPLSLHHRFNYVTRMLELGTNMLFRPRRPHEEAYLKLNVTGESCAAILGYTGGVQALLLPSFCEFPGTIAHELMHAVGFAHEHARSDRMDFVAVNQTLETDINYIVRNTTNYTPYDKYSIMHYGIGGLDIKTLKPDKTPHVRRAFPSDCDWHAINQRYPGRMKGPECVRNMLEDIMVPSLAFRMTQKSIHNMSEICKIKSDFRFFNRLCRISGGLEYPPMPWADPLKALRSDAVSRPVRREYCRRFQDHRDRKLTIFCRRACNVGCPADYSDLSLERCMAVVYPRCKQHGHQVAP